MYDKYRYSIDITLRDSNSILPTENKKFYVGTDIITFYSQNHVFRVNFFIIYF